MTKSLYIATTDPYSGKSLVSLGLMEMLLRRTKRVGIFRPVILRKGRQQDKNIELLLSHFHLKQKYEDTFVYSRQEAVDLISRGHYDELLDHIIEKYKAVEAASDFVLCIGSDLIGDGTAFEIDYNVDVARNLGCPVLIVSSGLNHTAEENARTVWTAIDSFREKGCQVFGAIVNRANPDVITQTKLMLLEELSQEDLFLAVIPANETLSSPSIREIAEYLDAEVLYGQDQIHKLAHRYLVIAMEVHNFLPYLSENALLITPGDRSDVILSAIQAHNSQNYPKIAGLVLTGGLKPPETVARLLEGISDLVPILSVPQDTYLTATRIGSVPSYITPDNATKIRLSLELFEESINVDDLMHRLSSVQPRGITPKMFIYSLVQQAKADKQHIVLPEGEDERILKATEILLKREIVDITLLGDREVIDRRAKRLSLDLDMDKLNIIQPRNSPQFEHYSQTLFALRQHKGLTIDHAHDMMSDVSYFGTMMVYQGHADGMVSGAVHTTLHTIRPALQFVKTKPGFSVVSSVFFMALEDEVLVYGDCAVNPNPTAEELAEIALASADTAQAFGIEPRVAMLSYSTGTSGVGVEVDKVRQATALAQQRRPDLLIEGPMQYDAAVDAGVARTKMPGSEVAGQATVFIFPDLNTGNNTYKAVQRETGAIAIGPVLQGLRKPVNDLSRGCTVEDIINTVAITAVQAQLS